MTDIDQTLEQLLSKASPRPAPDQEATAQARDAVRAEWQAVSGKHRTRQRTLRFALAASLVLGVFAVLNMIGLPQPDPVKVASIQKSVGSIYVLGEQSELMLADGLEVIHQGQTIVTGDDGGIALAWGKGGSVRLDRNTELDFVSDERVFLKSGRIYFDSKPSELIAGITGGDIESFEIDTPFGRVSHVGTQFMTDVGADELRVSVREGVVDVQGQYYPYKAVRGELVLLEGRSRPVVLSVPEYGDEWQWVNRVSPAVNVDGQSVHAFLTWVGREMGMSVEYGTVEVAQTAQRAILEGRVESEPAEALRMRMLTAALDWRFDGGVIYVSESN